MWIDQYRHTRHVFIDKQGNEIMFCSLTCAARYLKAHESEMEKLQVADYLTAELIDTDQAVYLVGSDAPPVMSNTSFIAFAHRDEAEEFRKQHGGRIMKFIEAIKIE